MEYLRFLPAVEVLVPIDLKTESAHGPQTLPGGRRCCLPSPPCPLRHRGGYTAAFWNNAQIVVQSLDSGQRKLSRRAALTRAIYQPGSRLCPSGHAFAVPFDPARLETTGIPFPVG